MAVQATSGNVGLTAAAGSPPPAWSGFRPLTITAVDQETSSVMSLRLVAADGAALPTPLAGAVPDRAPGHRLRRDRRAELLPLGATERRRTTGSASSGSRTASPAATSTPPPPSGRRSRRPRRVAPSPWHQEPTGRAGVGWCRRDTGAGHAARARRRRLVPSGVVGARRPERVRATLRRRGPRTAGAAARRALADLLQLAVGGRPTRRAGRPGGSRDSGRRRGARPSRRTLTCTCVVRRASWPT